MSVFADRAPAAGGAAVEHLVGAGRVLLASSTGGHLTELAVLVRRWAVPLDRQHWVVPRTPQSASMLEGREVTWARPVGSRDLAGAARNVGEAVALHRRLRPSVVLSAGAAQAVPHLAAAALHRTPVVYVESVARVAGPSVTGRMAARLPAAHLFTQATGAAGWDHRWRPCADVFSCFASVPVSAPTAIDRAVVTLGTERFGFPRAVAAALAALPAGADVTWQVGTTTTDGAVGALPRWLPAAELTAAMEQADVVVSHGGAGSVLSALMAGRVPVVLPRLSAHGEHVDDHQVEMCAALARRGLVVMVRPGEELGRHHLERAAGLRAVPSEPAAPTDLVNALGLAS